jgi:hypothetical protein
MGGRSSPSRWSADCIIATHDAQPEQGPGSLCLLRTPSHDAQPGPASGYHATSRVSVRCAALRGANAGVAKRLTHGGPSATHVTVRALSAWSPARLSRLTSRDGQRFEERQAPPWRLDAYHRVSEHSGAVQPLRLDLPDSGRSHNANWVAMEPVAIRNSLALWQAQRLHRGSPKDSWQRLRLAPDMRMVIAERRYFA